MPYQTSKDYDRMIELLGRGETVIYKRTPHHRWAQITANKPLKPGRKFTVYGMSQAAWLESMKHAGTVFIDMKDSTGKIGFGK